MHVFTGVAVDDSPQFLRMKEGVLADVGTSRC